MSIDVLPPDDVTATEVAARLVSDPLNQTVHSLALARSLGVIARLGLFSELADGPVSVADLAERFALQAQPLRMMLDVLTSENYLTTADDRYEVAEPARKWLDPRSPSSIIATLSYTLEYWNWWAELDQVAAGGAVATISPEFDDESGWLRQVRAYFEYARLIGDDLADAVDLPRYAESVLDIGSAHGWYSAVLCQRNPLLRATVVADAPAVTIGRELIWEAGLERSVTHQTGDMFTSDLGGPYDAVICFPLLFGLDHIQVMRLLARTRAVLRPGGLLITMRATHPDEERSLPRLASSALFLRLASRPDPISPREFNDQLAAAGFGVPRVHELASAPELSVYVARAV
jgi:2-polyprenyl-3-methyl-5-hydroxy-6-metoxy-1,4-benzoquinol methylase